MKHAKAIVPFLNFTKGVKKASLPLWTILFFLGTPTEQVLQPNAKEVAKIKQETLQAFKLISINLQKGIQVMEHLKHFETTRNKVVKP
ncbi:MAG: hypothetical protein AAGC43_03555 [Bacteroidota bacterium]